MEEKAGLHEALYNCIEKIRIEKEGIRKRISPIPDSNSLGDVARRIKTSDEFNHLVQVATDIAKSDNLHSSIDSFLKQFGFYHHMQYSQERINLCTEKLFIDLNKAQPCCSLYLLSLPWVNMNGLNLPIETDWFSVKRFSPEELECVLTNKIRQTFYPDAALSNNELELLSKDCWLVVKNEELINYAGLEFDFSELMGKIVHTQLHPKVELALGSIILLEWLPNESNRGFWWPGFPLGTFLKVSGNLFRAPCRPERGLIGHEFVDEGIPPQPVCQQYTCPDLDGLYEIKDMLETLKEDEYEYILERALRYLVRAATREMNSVGKVDQFIDHVICIEALLGEKKAGITSLMAQRAGTLVGLRTVVSDFRKIYDTRSTLIHGRKVTQVNVDESWKVRELARKIMLSNVKVMHYYNKHGYKLSRKQFLSILDFLTSSDSPEDLGEIVQRWPSND